MLRVAVPNKGSLSEIAAQMLAEAERKGMQRAAELSGQYHQVTHIRAAILAEMEKLK